MRGARVLLIAGATFLFAVPSAQADFHFMKVSEVYPGATAANPNDAFVELQMFAAGQNLVATHKVDSYTANGTLLASFELTTGVTNGESQRKILIGDTAVSGVTPDFTYDQLGDALKGGTATGGAVCFPDAQPPDCVSWGNFTPAAGFPNVQSTNAPVIPDGQSLTRSIKPGCPNLLEPSDDTDSSSVDFALTTPTPENNASPFATGCMDEGPDTEAPETEIDKFKVKGDKITVKFSADERVTFECKLDKKPYRTCTSPKKYKNLDEGKHKVKVRATDEAGNRGKAAKAKGKVK